MDELGMYLILEKKEMKQKEKETQRERERGDAKEAER